jgi:serine protease
MAQTAPDEEAVSDQIIVKYQEDVGPGMQADIRSEEGLEKKDELDLINAEVVKVEGQPVEEAISDLNDRPEVEYAEPDFKVYPAGYADEPRFGVLWGLNNTGQNGGTPDVDINGLEASGITQGDPNLVVAVIDDGVDFSHPDLADRAWVNPGESGGGKETNGIDDDGNGYIDDINGWDFFNDDNTLHHSDKHGTTSQVPSPLPQTV